MPARHTCRFFFSAVNLSEHVYQCARAMLVYYRLFDQASIASNLKCGIVEHVPCCQCCQENPILWVEVHCEAFVQRLNLQGQTLQERIQLNAQGLMQLTKSTLQKWRSNSVPGFDVDIARKLICKQVKKEKKVLPENFNFTVCCTWHRGVQILRRNVLAVETSVGKQCRSKT